MLGKEVPPDEFLEKLVNQIVNSCALEPSKIGAVSPNEKRRRQANKQ
jgi:hypothetical protein